MTQEAAVNEPIIVGDSHAHLGEEGEAQTLRLVGVSKAPPEVGLQVDAAVEANEAGHVTQRRLKSVLMRASGEGQTNVPPLFLRP